ncbi:MAG TPA: hypothetical protein VFE57_10355 [Cyclobacteriaceae bacterium]|jgi:hypothetical protein|nr:hypothetical protein [Cyclobacteriaceae bacterium]
MSSTIHTTMMPTQKIFELRLPPVTKRKLKSYCTTFEIPIDDFELKTKDRFWIPAHYFIGMFRNIIPKLHEQYPEFPLKRIDSFYGSNGGTYENRFFIRESIVLKMQERTKLSPTKYLFQVEFSNEKTGKIFLSGMFSFIGTVHSGN